jgi:hypothetical protein
MTAPDEYAPGEISRSFKRVEDAIKDLAGETKSGFAEVNTRFDLMRGEFVHKTEWTLHREGVERKFAELDKDIDEVKADAEKRHVPWTAVVGVVTGALALLAALGLIG